MTTVLFACIHNAGRSQMAAALFNTLADPTKARAISAGTQPIDAVHPEVVAVMHELGLDLASAKPQHLTKHLARQAQILITMGCGEACPVVPGVQRDDWPVADPKGQAFEQIRAIRDEIRHRVLQLIHNNGWEP